MRYLFPSRSLSEFSQQNKKWAYGIFVCCTIVSTLKGCSRPSKLDSYALINFFDSWNGLTRELYVSIVKFMYSPIGLMIKGLLAFTLFLWLVYKLSGCKKQIRFMEFILPFISFASIGLIFHIIGYIFYLITSSALPFIVVISIILYTLLFYYIILVTEYGISLWRSIGAISLSLLLVFLLSGWFSVAPYLSWI